MVRALSAALLLAASSASAAPLALPSFEGAAADLRAKVAALRAASVEKLDSGVGARLDSMAWDLQRAQNDARGMRDELRWLMSRVNAPQPGRPQDPNLRWDIQRFVQNLDSLTRDAQWRLSDLRALASQVPGKDATLVASAQRLANAANWLQSDAHWLAFDAGFARMDLDRAGFQFEAMDLDRNSRDLDQASQSLMSDSQALLNKVR